MKSRIASASDATTAATRLGVNQEGDLSTTMSPAVRRLTWKPEGLLLWSNLTVYTPVSDR